MEGICSNFSSVLHRGRFIYVEARLYGGAPWGFTLKGGLEHGEALIISKVEEGGKAYMLEHPLQVGDQVVNINEVELSGSRQEAISLVKGSYKSLQLTVCRDICPDPCFSEPNTPPSTSAPYSLVHGHTRESQGCPGGAELRIKNRRSEPASRPHSWHSTKLGEGQPDSSMMQISQGTMGTPWHQACHSSVSTTDLSSYDPGYLRKSPDQYSSRGSMESLDHSHPSYSSCQQLSPSKSSGSIDHLHSKRDSAYSSFSTSSSVPEYPAAAGLPMGKERSCSMDSMLAPQLRGQEGLRQADIRYVRTVYDAQQGISKEHEVRSLGYLGGGESRVQAEVHGGSIAHRGNSSSCSGGGNSTSNRHSLGPVWGSSHQNNSYESLKGAPPPPQRSDSYAAIRNHERPSSWSSLEQSRSTRSLYKGSWHHSSGSVAGGKSLFAPEGQPLHTLEEKSPESSPTTKPRQGVPQAPPTGRLMLPTGIYQVPPPEPHFAQAPASCPNFSSVYPALAKESRGNAAGVGCTGVGRDSPALENGYQSSASSTATQLASVPQPKSPSQLTDRQEAEPNCGVYKTQVKPQTESQSVSQMHGEEYCFRRDPYTPVRHRVEKQRHLQSPENMERNKEAKEGELMVLAEHRENLEAPQMQNDAVHPDRSSGLEGHRVSNAQKTHGNGEIIAPQSQQCENGSWVTQNHHGNPAAAQQDHPLTRLENALVEVQKAAGPERRVSSCSSQGGPKEEVPSGRVSVLEKVSRFEQQYRQGKMRSQSSSHAEPQLGLESRAKLSKGPHHLRTQSYSSVPEDCGEQPFLQRRRSTEQHQPRSSWSKETPLERSKSTFQLSEENGSKDLFWKEDLQDILGTIQDTSFNAAYRDSIKGAQSKVLRSTSFRRKDLSIEPHTPSKHLSLERKGPKTLPKPHTPKERQIVTPDLGDTGPPALPSIPPVGPPATVRIGGRKRLTLEQKKRCYSEPEKMNEVGMSEENDCLSAYGKSLHQLYLPEASVADRRKLFEMAAHRSAGPGPATIPRPGLTPGLTSSSSSSSRSDLKQLQQDALADYMERKTGRRMARSQRPQSSYLQVSFYSSDSQSLSSTSSLVSLQEPELQEASCRGGHQQGTQASSTLPPSVHGHLYPGGSFARPASSSESTSSTSSSQKMQGRSQRYFSLERDLGRHTQVTQPAQNLPFSQHHDSTFQRAAPARNSGKSASAEDLLDRSEDIVVPQHFRSRSSPLVEGLNQGVMTGDQRLYIMPKGPAPSIPAETRPKESVAPSKVERYLSNPGPWQLKTPGPRREKQKLSERHRAQSMSGLAASVGLPCPFSSPGRSDSQASAMLCPTSLEVLNQNLLPFMAPTEPSCSQTHQTGPGTTREGSADSGTSTEGLRDSPREGSEAEAPLTLRAASTSLSEEGQKSPPPSHQNQPPEALHTCPSPVDTPTSTPAPPLPFLRISESSIHFTSSQPLLPTEDLPLPPPPLPSFSAAGQDYSEIPLPPTAEPLQSTFGLDQSAVSPVCSPPLATSDLLPAAAVSDLSTEATFPSSANVAKMQAALEAQESLEVEYPVLSRRERSAEEKRAETLAQELMSREKSLTPVLDSRAVWKAMELMENVFPAIALPQQRRRSCPLEDSVLHNSRRQDRVPAAEEALVLRGDGAQAEMETDLDEAEFDLDQKKAELVQALSQSVAVLRKERAGLAEEQRKLSALSSRVEALLQEHCKANEYDKHRMFIGDLEKIVNLLLSLSGQLARVENALAALEGEETESSAEERESLQKRRQRLCSQHEDARELKENLDRRERLVLDILSGYLTPPQLQEYQRLVLVKPALLIRQRHLDELVRQAEEQLHRLSEEREPGSPTHCSSPPPARSPAVTSL
ncbi:hypothetical protein GJAV_G00041680 [Gymnothorax javanicus]|nr:hypothetical protein GJAV_G00041680 [Gymnothorax javanicus]